jgi:ligand-binding sensor domain-containing protein/signal transduction histidine kinase
MLNGGAALLRLFLQACLFASLNAEHLPVRIYTTADGLAGNTIDCIVRDSRGYLWFCTREGLSRFDGYKFQKFGAEQGLPPGDGDLIETAGHDYWIATSDGVARFRPTDRNPHFEIYRAAEPNGRFIQALAVDPAGGIWVGTGGGLYHLDPPHPPESSEWQLRLADIGLPTQSRIDAVVEALLVDRAGTLWVGARSGLYRRFPDGRHEGTRGGLPHPEITALAEDHEGRLWAGTGERGVCRIQSDGGLTDRRPEDVCPTTGAWKVGAIHKLYESSDGVLWAGSLGLSSYLSGGGSPVLATYTERNGLPGGGSEILGIAEDLAGNLWAGSDYGAIRIAKGGFRAYSEADGLHSSYIVSIFEARNGELCVMSEKSRVRVVNRFDGHRFYSVQPNLPPVVDDWGWGTGQLTLQARNEEWWIPTGMGVFRFPALPVRQLGRTPPSDVYAKDDSVYALFEDSRGGVWISTQILGGPKGPARANGIARWDPSTGELRRYSDRDGVPSGQLATAFAEDRTGAVWIGLSTGSLLRFADGKVQAMPPPGGQRAWVWALHLDRDGRLWIATSRGVFRIDPEVGAPTLTYTTAAGLASNDVTCITEDLQGRIYLGTNHGVDRISPGVSLRIRHYTTADGLAPGGVLAAFRDRKGVLWFGAREGLSRLVPEPDEDASPPPVFITGLRVRGAAHPVSALGEIDLSGLELPPDQNQVELEFVALGFRAGETLRYQYRLEGRDLDWSPPAEQRTVNYASLAPGSYRWQVRAITADGIAGAPATASFTVLTPIWQRWWVQLPVVILLCALLYATYRRRIERLLELERLRTRIATDLHDDIGSTLSQIAILSEVAHRTPATEEGVEPLSDIACLSRELVDSMSDIVWAIDPEQDRLDDLSHRMRRFASDLFSTNGAQVRFQTPATEPNPLVGAEIRRQVFLIYKESLHNMARHSGCTEVEIRLRLEGLRLELAIADNGKGFDSEQVHGGHGLASMARRAKQMGGSLAVDSAPGRGTVVHLEVPLAPGSLPFWRRFPHKWAGTLSVFRRILKGRAK